MRDGRLVHMLERSDIEHRDSTDIAGELKRVFDQHCSTTV
jgi:putative YphP/YqiW family bacilliredoxin